MPDIVTDLTKNHELKTEYTIEYITDPEKWKIVCADQHTAPWELYDIKRMEDFSEAMAWVCCAMFQTQRIFDVKLFESAYLDGKLVRERDFILPSWFHRTMELSVNDAMRRDHEQLSAQHDEDTELIADMTAFMEKFHALEKFKEFHYERQKERLP